MNVEEMNNTLNKVVKPNEIMKSIKEGVKDAAGFGTLEADIVVDHAGEQFNKIISNVGKTGNEVFKDFIGTVVNGVTTVMDKQQEIENNKLLKNNISIINTTKGLYPTHQYPMNSINQTGGNNESEFMKYVYTEKPIWFTKKDMIWN
jgi:hypothetical protein